MRRLIKVDKCEDAAAIVKEYEKKICTKKKNIIYLAYQQVKVFLRFKEITRLLLIDTITSSKTKPCSDSKRQKGGNGES